MQPAPIVQVDVARRGRAASSAPGIDPTAGTARDWLATEEPLEIVVHHRQRGRPARTVLSVTMRTPGDDAALVAGFLYTEGIVRRRDEIATLAHCGRGDSPHGTMRAALTDDRELDLSHVGRGAPATASCGACGRLALDVHALPHTTPRPAAPRLASAVVHALPERLRAAQALFASTGGMHAAALCSADGTLLRLAEDVGRHNAVDKVIGAALLAGELPLHDRILVLSGRAGWELVQKALIAGVGVVAAIGAPTSLAVEHAARGGLTLLGFVRDARFTVYAGAERIADG